MGNLDAERHILTAIFAFCHVSHLLFYSVTDDMIADCRQKSKLFFIFCGSLCEKLENGRRPCYNIEQSKAETARHICGYGGIGRRAGFRIRWATMQVRSLLSAPQKALAFCRCFFQRNKSLRRREIISPRVRQRNFSHLHSPLYCSLLKIFCATLDFVFSPCYIFIRKGRAHEASWA